MEPKVDAEKWQNDYGYRYEKVDELLAYLDTFENFEERVKSYRNLCAKLGGIYPLYGQLQYFQQEGIRDSDGNCIDGNGEKIPYKIFGLNPKTHSDKFTLNRFAFNERRENLYKHTHLHPKLKPIVIPYSDLVDSYYERLSKTKIRSEFVRGELEKVDGIVNAFSGSDKVASQMAYKDIMLIEPIDWADFSVIVISALGVSLTCVWDLVEYQIFLKKEIIEPQEIKIKQVVDGRYFDIQKYRWITDADEKWNYISDCIKPYLSNENSEYRSVIKELKFIYWEIESKSSTFTMSNTEYGKTQFSIDVKILKLIENQLHYYRHDVHRQPKLFKDPLTGREVYGLTDEQKVQHDKMFEPDKDIDGNIIEYTFQDWLDNKFIYSKGLLDRLMLNDSENYLDLVSRHNMTYETINRIQDVQAHTYDALIEKTLAILKDEFTKSLTDSLMPDKLISVKINQVENFLNENTEIHFDIIRPKLHRQRKFGSKFITSNQFLGIEKEYDNIFIDHFPDNHYDVLNDYVFYKDRPTRSQILYCKVEIMHRLLSWLKEKAENNSKNNLPSVTSKLFQFDKYSLEEVFWPDAVDKYWNIEKQLWTEGYFTEEGHWKKRNPKANLLDLVKLIKLLEKNGYFKIMSSTNKQLKSKNYRIFFENRYKCNISQQFTRHRVDIGTAQLLFPFVYKLE